MLDDMKMEDYYITFVHVMQNGADDVVENEDFFTIIFRVESYTIINIRRCQLILLVLNI